jgi:hypothetical protein
MGVTLWYENVAPLVGATPNYEITAWQHLLLTRSRDDGRLPRSPRSSRAATDKHAPPRLSAAEVIETLPQDSTAAAARRYAPAVSRARAVTGAG